MMRVLVKQAWNMHYAVLLCDLTPAQLLATPHLDDSPLHVMCNEEKEVMPWCLHLELICVSTLFRWLSVAFKKGCYVQSLEVMHKMQPRCVTWSLPGAHHTLKRGFAQKSHWTKTFKSEPPVSPISHHILWPTLPYKCICERTIYLKRGQPFICKRCQFNSRQKSLMREHAETHMEGPRYPCNLCGKTMRWEDCMKMNALKCVET